MMFSLFEAIWALIMHDHKLPQILGREVLGNFLREWVSE
jgi:hypothetical protein